MKEKRTNHRLSASVKTGIVALMFLLLGFQLGKLISAIIVRDNDGAEGVPSQAVVASCPEDTVSVGRSFSEKNYSGDRQYKKESYGTTTKQTARSQSLRGRVESFRFDPNTVSSEDLQRLGFSLKQARAILNYREKGGRFHRKSDFAKSFVVADSVFARLEPYIDIPLLDINAADSADFDALPGIGPYFASRMVSYRKSLGGYSYTEQLMDIRNFDKDRYDGLRDLIYAGPSEPYGLWSLPEDSLKLHPYIGSYSAHGIILYRKNTPPEEWSVLNLDKAGILKPGMAEKLAGCRLE